MRCTQLSSRETSVAMKASIAGSRRLLAAALAVALSAAAADAAIVTKRALRAGGGGAAILAAGSSLEAVRLAEAEDASFWRSEWAALEEELARLSSIAGADPKKHQAVIPPNVNLNPKSVADLVPALAMLKGLYEDGKERIGKLNAREKDLKRQFEVKEAEHTAKLAKIQGQLKEHKVSQEFCANETRDENRFWSYWARVRERQHRQYHTGLKIQHATLQKVKKLIDMYDKTMSGKTAEAKKELERIAPPEIVFLAEETRRVVGAFCQESLREVDAARSELRRGLRDPEVETKPF